MHEAAHTGPWRPARGAYGPAIVRQRYGENASRGARALDAEHKSPTAAAERISARGLTRRWALTLALLAALAVIDYWLVSGGTERVRTDITRADAASLQRTLQTAEALARLNATLFVANVIMLFVAAVFVFRPMVSRVHDHMVRLARTNEELRARTRELEHARRQALQNAADADQARKATERGHHEMAERNRELETMLYVISHDLREPLRAIEQFSQLVRDRYNDRLDAKGSDLLGRTVRAAQRMRTLLDDLLELSRARRLRAPDETVDGKLIVADVLERVSTRVDETRAKIRVARDLPCVRADRLWAVQALYNLVMNALKFTRDGDAPDVEIAGYRDEAAGAAGFVVRDRGAGVAHEHVERIFRLFQRAVGREIEGTGAGLAIVAAVAERHGGRAWVEPRAGGGSEFIITFARDASETAGVAA